MELSVTKGHSAARTARKPADAGAFAKICFGILSSNREETIRTCLRANGVENLFAFVIGYPKLFGKAKALRRILKSRDLERAELLYVGDETRDIEAAHKAKVRVAACLVHQKLCTWQAVRLGTDRFHQV